jgi:hypothetical protein
MKFKQAVEEAVKGKAIRCLRWGEEQAVMLDDGEFWWVRPALRGPQITDMKEEWEVI